MIEIPVSTNHGMLRGPLRERGLALLAIVAGGAGFALARQYLQSADSSIAQRYARDYAPQRVLVAAAPLAAGETLTAARLAARSMPQRFLPSGVVPADSLASVLYSRLRVALQPGDPLQGSLLRSESESMAARLPAGSRGLALGCEALGPLGSMLRSGDRLDVWLPAEPDRVAVAASTVSDIVVVGTSADSALSEELGGTPGSCSLTLRVDPAQAGRFLAAAGDGTISAVLRPREEPPPPALPPGNAAPAVQVRRAVSTHRSGEALELLSADGHSLNREWLLAGVAP